MTEHSSLRRIGAGILGWSVLLALWFFATLTRLVDPLFVASPMDTAIALSREGMSGHLLAAASLTTGLALLGFCIGVLIGVPLGLMLGGVALFRRIFGGIVDSFRSVPSTALFPIFLLFFGVGRTSKIAVAAFVCTLALAIYTAAAVPAHDSTRRFLLRLHHAPWWRRFLDGLFFPALPGVIGGMRTAVSMALVGTIANEMIIGTDLGLGRYIYDAQMTFRIPEMYAAIIVAGLVGVLLNRLLVIAVTYLVRWRQFDEANQPN